MATARLGAVSPWGLFLVLGLSASGRLAAEDKAMPANPQDALYLLTLENAVAGDRPLVLHLDCEGGKFTAGLGLTPRYNKNPHDVDLSGLKLDGNRVQGPVKVTIIADPWMPVDGKPVACAYDLDASLANGELSGTFKGQFGGKKVEGRITGTLRARPEVRNCRVKVWLGAALLRLWLGRGPNYKYALDMELTLPIRDGKVFEPKLESTVPDYRGYSAIVTKHDLKLEGHSLTGSLEVDVDYGGQGSVPKGGFDKEKHVFTLHGLVFGATVGGTYDIQVGELSAQGHRFIGALNSAPPPPPAASICQFRLHNAMKEGPVVLHLALNDKGPIHGYALCPRYNHELHAVDASGLKLEGPSLKGAVRVTIAPDCYRPPEKITMEYVLDARIDGEEMTGSFTGRDRGQDYRGPISGEIRPKKAPQPLVNMANLSACDLNLRNPTGVSKNVLLRWRDGKFVDGEVASEQKPMEQKGTVTKAELKIENDRLTGAVSFTLKGEAGKETPFDYTFEAILDGGELHGFWRATSEGKPLLCKSSKLYGKISAGM